MALTAANKLGSHEMLSLVGAGGMAKGTRNDSYTRMLHDDGSPNGSVRWALAFAIFLIPVSFGQASIFDVPAFHRDAARTGLNANETELTPASVAGGFGLLWNCPRFDSVNGNVPHAYASLLYADQVTVSAGPFRGAIASVAIAATSNDYVYAVNVSPTSFVNASSQIVRVPTCTVLWKSSLGTPTGNVSLDRVPLGILSTPVVDMTSTPPRVYVVSADATAGHRAFALDLTSGSVISGWPLSLNNSSISPLNPNGTSVAFGSTDKVSQRGALNLSKDGRYLYIPFGGYSDTAPGWLVKIDTRLPAIASSFSGSPASSGITGIWGAGGCAIDSTDKPFCTTGNSSTEVANTPGYWGDSLLSWNSTTPLSLSGTYTPWNYCQMDAGDVDLGGGSPVLVPSLADTGTTSPNLAVFGSKQGVIYAVDRDNLRGSLTARQTCGSDASADLSLMPPGIQQPLGTRGPLIVFGPYSEGNNNFDYAKARSTPAFWRGPNGTPYIFVTGSHKASIGSSTSAPPGIYRLRIAAQAGQPAYLQVDGSENATTLLTPGSPEITSNGTSNGIVWVLVANIPRPQSLNRPSQPFLAAFDALTLRKIYQSASGELFVGGKYNSPLSAHGKIFVATDRIQAFGLLSPSPPPPSLQWLPWGVTALSLLTLAAFAVWRFKSERADRSKPESG
jgi:hypothetical protein